MGHPTVTHCVRLHTMHSVLLIDDDGKLAEVLTDYCAQFDIRIEPALRPSIGLEKLDSFEFDAVILDVMMPEMDGFEVCKRIRSCLLYTSPSPRDKRQSRMPSSA